MRFDNTIHSPPKGYRVKGYMTIEASVIIPITIGITVLSIWIADLWKQIVKGKKWGMK